MSRELPFLRKENRAGEILMRTSKSSCWPCAVAATIDLGAGAMTPMGNIDVFVAKLSASGKLIFAKQLGLCGDGVQSLAVDRTGRIAISGTVMGTVVLDAQGELEQSFAFSGFV